jgi:uncharacterized protein (DUF362 family)/NAD-dependent dihydropyrimidine dehydrogenase PreA subunit
MTLPVVLRPLADYAPQRVREALLAALEPLGGMAAFVRPGQQVLVKPNLLAGKPPEAAVTTHPELVRQVILLAQAAGGLVSVGDSPGIGSPEVVARKCGILQVVEETGARFAPFVGSVSVQGKGGTFHHLEVARELLDSDVVINLPKLKTHQMMGFTGAVKNLFGVVVGMRKVRLHLQAGDNPAFFALMLLELAERYPPALSIMDGVVGMEGNGPGSGDPVAVGALLASAHPLALDTVAAALVGLDPQTIWPQRVAMETGRPGSRLDEVTILGPSLADLRPQHFSPAPRTDVGFGLPQPLRRLLRNSLSARPEIARQCVRCGDCVRHCPPSAMHLDPHGVAIDYQKCIRCFCCQELCSHGAVLTRQGMLLRLVGYLGRGR